MGQLRIIGGIHRSRIIKFKDNIDGLRPTPDRVRETVFNWLGQTLNGKTCLDLFAGSGAMGFEAISRGAKSVMMIEANKSVYPDLVNNAKLLKIAGGSPVGEIDLKLQDAINYINQGSQSFDIIFIDPPFDSDLLQISLNALRASQLLNENSKIYIECQKLPDLTGYKVIKEGKAAMVRFFLIKVGV